MDIKTAVLDALMGLKGPDGNTSLPASGALSEVIVVGNDVFFSIAIDPKRAMEMEGLREAAENTVRALKGVENVRVTLTSERVAQPTSSRIPPVQERQVSAKVAALKAKAPVKGIANIIAVASGKGGVGKSTTAVNLALALQHEGLKVGMLDADIYGPSLPRLLKLTGKPELNDAKQMLPMQAYGLSVMSMGFLIEEDAAVIWRGPMVISAVQQMLTQVQWDAHGALDVLVVDMPPGTGDAHLTLAQAVPLAGAVIVSTPQDLALIDARRAVSMFTRLEIPLFGLIENMSYFACPSCGTRTNIFGHGGAQEDAVRMEIPFLGAIPLHMALREASDAGVPVSITTPQGEHARAYLEIAKQVKGALMIEKKGQA
jgi:ATP-binding protein involved in chromosome partitioning